MLCSSNSQQLTVPARAPDKIDRQQDHQHQRQLLIINNFYYSRNPSFSVNNIDTEVILDYKRVNIPTTYDVYLKLIVIILLQNI